MGFKFLYDLHPASVTYELRISLTVTADKFLFKAFVLVSLRYVDAVLLGKVNAM